MESNCLPLGWSKAKVGEVAVLLRGVTYSKDQASNSPEAFMKPILRGNNINGELNFDDLVYVPETLITPGQVITAGDIIFAMSSGSKHLVGKSAKCRTAFNGSFGAFCGLLRATEAINKDFLHYIFQGSDFRRAISEVSKGSNINNLKREHILDFEFSCPPLAEQHRIVAKIEELFSELDHGVASLKTAREQLKVYRQSLLKNAFEGKLTAAIGWREKSLGQLLEFLTSGSRGWAAYYATSGDLFVRAQNIKHDRLELDDVAFVALPGKAEGLRTRIQQGDLLITITGANVTKSALVKHDLGTAYVSQHVALCRPMTEIRPEYLYWFIVAEAAGRKQLTDMAYGAGKPGLNLENIRSVNVPFPGLHEQREIVQELESKLSEADQLDQTLATALQQADALRQSILKKAFCGQLVQQDKNDEPATTLLERIRAKKSIGINKPGKRGRSG